MVSDRDNQDLAAVADACRASCRAQVLIRALINEIPHYNIPDSRLVPEISGYSSRFRLWFLKRCTWRVRSPAKLNKVLNIH